MYLYFLGSVEPVMDFVIKPFGIEIGLVTARVMEGSPGFGLLFAIDL